MAENNFDNLVREISAILSSLNGELTATTEQFHSIVEILKHNTKEDILALRQITTDRDVALRQILSDELKIRKQLESDLNSARQKAISVEEEELALKKALSNSETETQKQFFSNKLQQLEEEKQLLEQQIELSRLKLSGDTEEYIKAKARYEQDAQQRQEKLENDKRLAEEETKVKNAEIEKRKKFVDTISNLFDSVVRTYTSAIDNVTNIYNQQAGKMSAALGTTVNDISNLQSNIASQLRNTNLSDAISNVAVMSEAASLVNAGYTNQSTLQQNAVDIAVAKQIAPNTNFENSSVKNLINVFGADFTHKFAAIERATQETAGASISITTTLSDLMSGMEPVFLNAQYQQDALQGTADVEATLSNARQQGVISQTQEAEYKNMILELMDPSRAFKSKNVAVLTAATQYDYGSANPAEALAALLSSTRQYYSNFDQSNSYWGTVSRSLGGDVAGNSPLDAAYNIQGYTGVEMLRATNLDSVYKEQLGDLQSGEYTTAQDRIRNRAENSSFVQIVADFSKSFPRTYNTISGVIIASIKSVEKAILTRAVTPFNSGGTGTTPSPTGTTNTNNIPVSNGTGSGGTLGSFFFDNSNIYSTTRGKIKNTNLSGAGSALIIGNAVRGAGSIFDYAFSNNEDTFAQSISYNGNIGKSMLDQASVGAGIGSALGMITATPLGSAAGAAIGGLVGAITGLTSALWAQHEIEEKNTSALEELNNNTTDVLGEGLTKLTDAEAKAQIYSGGGTISLASGVYGLDLNVPKAARGMAYVPYDDYLVKVHKGEAIVTANAANELRKRDPNFWSSPSTNSVADSEVIYALERQTNSIVNAVKGDTEVLPMTSQEPKQYTIRNNN